jgi:TamB, inner membrane protein subunit of TAM complex
MKSTLKKFLKFSALSLLLLIALVVGGAVAVIQHPQWVFTPKNMAWLAAKARSHGIEVSWQELEIDAHTPQFLKPELGFRFTHLDVKKEGAASELKIDGKLKSFAIAAKLDFSKFPPQLIELGPTIVQGGDVEVTPATTPAKAENPKSGSFQIPSALQKTRIQPIHVAMDHWKIIERKVIQPSGNLEGSLNLVYEKGPDQLIGQPNHQSIHGEFVAFGARPVKMQLQARVNSDAGTGASGQPTTIEAVLTGTMGAVSPEIRTVSLNNCHVHLVLRDPAAELATDCPLEIVAETIQFKQVPQVAFENKFGLKVTADFKAEDYADQKKPIHAQAKIDLTKFYPFGKARPGFTSWGSFAVEGDAIPAKPFKDWQIHSKVDVELAIAEFHNLVEILDKTAYAVPAPFHVLHGEVHFMAKGELNPRGGEIPLELHTELHSKEQNFVVDSKGHFKFRKELASEVDPKSGHELGYDMNLQLDAALTSIKLMLPHFDLSSFPKLAPDTRIREEIEAHNKSGPGRFSYQIHVTTPVGPVKIVTNLASAPIPIRADIQLDTKQPPLGKISIEMFPVDVFKRQATIEKFELSLEPKKQPIDGVIQVVYTDYTVKIVLKGTVADPIYQFTSEPALPEQEVIAVLLFGKTSGDLDSDQTDSVGSVRGAAADKSLDLASLYLLAATPIESVGYDPTSGAVTAKIKIANGTSLNVAGGGPNANGLQTVGIRKRLGNNFSITTEVTSSQLDQSGGLAGSTAENSQKTVSALLEWRHRY